jgi:hypothetical protein
VRLGLMGINCHRRADRLVAPIHGP